MKKKRKIKKKRIKKKQVKTKKNRKNLKKKNYSKHKKRFKKKKILRKNRLKSPKAKQKKFKETIRNIIRIGEKLKPKIQIRLNLDQLLLSFFQGISNKIKSFKEVIEEEKEKSRLAKLRIMQKEKKEEIKKRLRIKDEEIKKKKNEIKEELKLEKDRRADLKKFIREEQAQLRKEQAERQRKFYEKIKLEKKIDQFRKREALEINNLEKFVIKQEREDFQEVQERINKIKLKYQAIRDQKIKERIEQLGISVSDTDTREELLQKEFQFNIAREKIENTLESFYRSMVSCVFQLNKRWLPKKMSLFRVIDKRYETSEIFIKLDEDIDENWIMLVYLKDNDPNSNIVVEDKTNPEKNTSKEYNSSEIFNFSDKMVDSLTMMIDREYKKKLN
ncbi:MAG: hypothetical protein CL687_01250 [Candidatus Pelagibacter sp.]|nr:hypothetical protein [Candidatus Pelagibacter sp.]|tara:strand:- start:83 stop:1249 length:1167 start_codon:yes stop_codon:yes gene_type:complete